ncbi:hypothetical protein ESY86_02055 [Subsaximicrobium wynnwilliamsii]|uniref:BamA/TamA family outer membrane protein n=2 Tax=Subsaximicrobium wynnwilliamsii TaxID=291179 RepID=A0A5C6ZL30_9FLAO|nr:hypothetical protein ESY87_00365 [Subsaximicrobium wynnwilliamsii]TXD90957.1 hypothetical protein ESY86_02055 [Subsaximicrobium wynnwilliamsii]TXE05466.1 hypothetical protein ESY88_00365 [Subsaximicrobium wynnwilliamsii]
MLRHLCLVIFLLFAYATNAQVPTTEIDTVGVDQDSLSKTRFIKQLGNGYFPTQFLDIDLRYLVKFNQYEGFRTGLGGVTNDAFSAKYRINSYVVYGFRDHRFKYRIGGGFRVNAPTNTWINLSYTDDLQETGSSDFITDKRFFSFFEPRLLNINLFHKYITKAVSVEHSISYHLLSETELAISKIDPTYDYLYRLDGIDYKNWHVSTAKIALQWSPYSTYEVKANDAIVEKEDGYPKFTLQLTKSFKDVVKGDFNFFKTDFRAIHKFKYNEQSFTEATLTTNIAFGDAPLSHLYHAYPNNVNKPTIIKRFSVAGINSFETMFFNEFFSDRLATLQLKHYVKPFDIGKRFKPQLVLISRFALGNMNNIARHQNIDFNTLDRGFSEAGLEINKLLFGFGLSFAYRYGAYHLPTFEDNLALKFTFNISL